MKDCIFCKIASGEIPCHKIYENDKVIAFLDINPCNKGHTLIVPKQHYENIESIPENLLCEVVKAAKKIASLITKAMGANSFGLSVNNGREAGQIVLHLHFHIIPRFKGDGLEPWHQKKYADGEAEKIAEIIRKRL